MSALILGIETSCDETAAAVVGDDGVVRSSVVASQADLHARYGGVVPEIASRRHLELVAPVVRAALDDAAVGARRHRRASASRRARASSARCSSGSRPPRRSPGRADCRSCRSTTSRRTSPRCTSSPDPLEPPFTCLLASGGHTLVLAVRDRAGFEVLGSTLDDAAGRGVRQGRQAARARLPGRRRDRPARARGRPRGVRVPGRARARPRLLVLGPQDRAPLRRARPRRGRA